MLGLTVTRVRAATGGHSQLTLRRDLDVLDGIAFGRADLAEVVHEGDRLDVVARLVSRTFGGFESLQLEIRDAATAGSHPEAAAILAGRRPRRLAGRGRRMTPARRPAAARRRPVRHRPGRHAGRARSLSVVGLLLVALVTLNLLNGEVPFVGGETGERRERQRQRRADRGRRRRRTSSSSRPRSTLPGLDRVRQGRQHLGPDRQGRRS